MGILGVVAALVALQAAVSSSATLSATDLSNATKYDLTRDGSHITSCTVTATSGSAQIDRYVCDAARSCGDRYSDAARQATCMARKREELASQIARNLARPK